jgi:hypothetical protein
MARKFRFSHCSGRASLMRAGQLNSSPFKNNS